MQNLRLLTAALLAGGLITGPALARHHQATHHAVAAMNNQQNVSAMNTADTAGSNNNATLVDADQLLQNASGAITNMQSDSNLVNLMSRAKAVFIIPNSGSGSSGGVLLTNKNGRWSNPVFFNMGGGALGGVQPAAKGTSANGAIVNNGPVALLIMSNRAMSRFENGSNFSIAPSKKLNIVNYSPNPQQAPQVQQPSQGQQAQQVSRGTSDIIVWSGNNSANMAAAPNFTQISANTLYNQTIYGTGNMHQILAGRAPLTNQLAVNLSTSLPASQTGTKVGTREMTTRPG